MCRIAIQTALLVAIADSLRLVAHPVIFGGRQSSFLSRMSEAAEVAEEPIPPLTQHPRRRVALLVEPTPFTHVSGYSNRFKEMLRYLKDGGDEAEVVTADDSVDRPADWLGIPINYIPGFRFPLYPQVQLTLDVGWKGLRDLERIKPDVMHAVAPGFFVIPAVVYARLLNVPLVISYHTHLPAYAAKYVTIPGLRELSVWACERILPLVMNNADLTLTTSPQLKAELAALGCTNLDVWRKGIDANVFNPSYNVSNEAMREQLSDGEPHRPLLLYVGRLGAEKNIEMIRDVLERIPQARLAIVGAGPAEQDLRTHFAGTDTTFMGLMQGDDLSRAYAAADVFVMPSESETLGFVVLESMASEVPAVCSAAGGLVNLVKDGKTGFLCEPGNTTEMAEKVRMLLSDDQLRRKMGAAGREETLNWDWKAATSILRNKQYSTAEKRFAERIRLEKRSQSPSIWLRYFRRQSSAASMNIFGGNMTYV